MSPPASPDNGLQQQVGPHISLALSQADPPTAAVIHLLFCMSTWGGTPFCLPLLVLPPAGNTIIYSHYDPFQFEVSLSVLLMYRH